MAKEIIKEFNEFIYGNEVCYSGFHVVVRSVKAGK